MGVVNVFDLNTTISRAAEFKQQVKDAVGREPLWSTSEEYRPEGVDGPIARVATCLHYVLDEDTERGLDILFCTSGTIEIYGTAPGEPDLKLAWFSAEDPDIQHLVQYVVSWIY
jgi:hypothetical protein